MNQMFNYLSPKAVNENENRLKQEMDELIKSKMENDNRLNELNKVIDYKINESYKSNTKEMEGIDVDKVDKKVGNSRNNTSIRLKQSEGNGDSIEIVDTNKRTVRYEDNGLNRSLYINGVQVYVSLSDDKKFDLFYGYAINPRGCYRKFIVGDLVYRKNCNTIYLVNGIKYEGKLRILEVIDIQTGYRVNDILEHEAKRLWDDLF